MLIEFRVTNFRSLRDEQVFSFVAAKDTTQQNTHIKSTGHKAVPNLLQSAVVYGANGSGKSNLIKALQYMRGVVIESATVIQPGQTYAIQPFRLDSKSASEPTKFELTFLLEGVRYQYSFAMTQQRIINEYLLVYKTSKPRCWFRRHYNVETDNDIYEFSSDFKGSKQDWVTHTRENSLFMSMATQFNSKQLRPVFDWFANNLVIFNELAPLNPQVSTQMLQNTEDRKRICNFLTAADMSITDIEVTSHKVPGQAIHFDRLTGKTEVRSEEIEKTQFSFLHITEQGKAIFNINDESNGTRNLLFLTGPVLNILNKGQILVVDELDTSLHTLLLRELVKLFHQPEINKNGAQLIFTSHNTSLLDVYGLFRRDQIWIIEKGADQASTLIALSEFSPRKNEALERNYLTGRYGGVPYINQNIMLKN